MEDRLELSGGLARALCGGGVWNPVRWTEVVERRIGDSSGDSREDVTVEGAGQWWIEQRIMQDDVGALSTRRAAKERRSRGERACEGKQREGATVEEKHRHGGGGEGGEGGHACRMVVGSKSTHGESRRGWHCIARWLGGALHQSERRDRAAGQSRTGGRAGALIGWRGTVFHTRFSTPDAWDWRVSRRWKGSAMAYQVRDVSVRMETCWEMHASQRL